MRQPNTMYDSYAEVAVACLADGERLGTVSGAQLRPDTGAVTSVLFTNGAHDFMVPMDAIALLGRDVVLVRNSADVRRASEGERLVGRALKSLQGIPVTTRVGVRLGSVLDLSFDRISGKLKTLLLSNQRALDVHPPDVLFGLGKVLVPAESAGRVRSIGSEDYGLLTRIRARSGFRRTIEGVRRALML